MTDSADVTLGEVDGGACKAFKAVSTNVLENFMAGNYKPLVENLNA
jgi:hypothetical protein